MATTPASDFRADDATDGAAPVGPLEIIGTELIEVLDFNRKHVFEILEGLSEEQLRRPVLPSGWCPLGMVKHLAIDAEHYWAGCIIGGQPMGWFTENGYDGQGGCHVGDDESAADIFTFYRREIANSNGIIRRTPLDMPVRQAEAVPDDDLPTCSSVVIHMIDETACHTGHLTPHASLSTGASGAGRNTHETADFTSSTIFLSTRVLQACSAYDTGHRSPLSRFAASWKPRVEYRYLNLPESWKKTTILPSASA